MFFIQSFKSKEYQDITNEIGYTEKSIQGYRGRIFDRKGEVLAETINKYTFWVNTQKEFDKEKIIELFSKEFNRPDDYYRNLISRKKFYIKLSSGLLRTQSSNILSDIKNIQGLQCDVSVERYYPYNSLAGQVVGYVDKDHVGPVSYTHLRAHETLR